MRTVVLLLFVLIAVGGCSSHGGKIAFDTAGNRTSIQRFDQAYIALTKTSEIEVVMIEDEAQAQYKAPKKKAPLQPIKLPPLRQVLRIHMYWQPMTLTTKNPAAINASVHWYVLGAEGSEDVMTYEGAAFVVLEGSGDVRDVRIKDGQIAPKGNNSEGRLRDPIGPARLHGKVVARLNKARVNETLQELEQYTATAGK